MKSFLLVIVIVLALIGCNKQKKIKKVSGKKCTECATIFSPETTVVTGQYNKKIRVLTTPEGKVYNLSKGQKFILEYQDTLCEECSEQRKQEANEAFRIGKNAYKHGDYETASRQFERAERLGHKDGLTWKKKADKKLSKEREKRRKKMEDKARKEKEFTRITTEMNARIAYGKKLQKQVKRGMTIDVYGKEYEIISLKWVGMEDGFISWFRTTDDYQDIKELGFKHIQFLDGLQYFKSIIVY